MKQTRKPTPGSTHNSALHEGSTQESRPLRKQTNGRRNGVDLSNLKTDDSSNDEQMSIQGSQLQLYKKSSNESESDGTRDTSNLQNQHLTHRNQYDDARFIRSTGYDNQERNMERPVKTNRVSLVHIPS